MRIGTRHRAAVSLLFVLVLIVAGCGGDKNPMAPQAPTTPAAQPPATPPASPAAQSPATPPAPPAAPPATGAVSNVELVATSAVQAPAGTKTTFTLTFQVNGQEKIQVSNTLAWRVQGKDMQFGNFGEATVNPGSNRFEGLWFQTGSSTAVGTTFELFGVVRVAGQQYMNQVPVIISVTSPQQAAATPEPQQPPPGPSQPPMVPPAAPPQNPPGALPVQPPVGPTQPADPRHTQIKAQLEQKGLRVFEVGSNPAKTDSPPTVFAIVEANYPQPAFAPVLQLAFTVWEVLLPLVTVDSPEAAQTVLIAGEAWNKYLLVVRATVNDLGTFIKSLQAAGSDEQRQQATQAFLQTVRFRVYDTERQQFVDEKDFIDKNFAK